MFIRILITCSAAFFGTFGFAILIRTPRRAWVPASAIGTLAYLIYDLLGSCGFSEPFSIFIGSLCGSILALICARHMRMIGTIFLTLSIVAFVPGLGLYRCMQLIGSGETSAGVQQGISAMISIAMIALGQGTGSFIFYLLPHRKAPGKL